MRWLALKDLQILRRSPFLVVVLIAYPLLISTLIGLALSKGPDKPKVAFVNLVPPERNEVAIGGETVDISRYSQELFKSIEPVRVRTRAEALEKVRSGEALGALILPEDATEKLESVLSLASAEPPVVEVVYNAEDPVKRRFVEATIEARLADANQALSDRLTELSARYLEILLRGGEFSVLGRDFDVLGLQRSKTILDAIVTDLPRGSPNRTALEQVSSFAGLAVRNLDLAQPLLRSVGNPVQVRQTVLDGARTPLDAFAAAVAITISLMFVTVLLGAGMLALEREENAFGRLVRGLVGRTALVAEKVGLSAACATVVGLAMTALLSLSVGLEWERFPLWVAALGAGALGFAALGVAIGALAREVRAASLLAFLATLPIAFLALVPSGAVSTGLYDAIRVVSALFPFRPALHAIDSAVNDAGAIALPLAHLAALVAAWGLLARVALRRFA